MTSWIKLHRQILEWEHFTEPTVLQVWVCLLALTKPRQHRVHGVYVHPNEVLISYRDLHEITGLAIGTVKSAIDKLRNTGEISVQVIQGAGTLVRIEKFQQFQSKKRVSMVDTPTDTPVDTPTDTEGEAKNQKNKTKKQQKTTDMTEEKPKKSECKAVTRYDIVFEESFRKLTGDTFIWSKRENVAVNTIVGKIAKMMDETGANSSDAELKEENFRIFLDMLYDRGDTWIRTNFVPHVIADKFTEYYQRIKNYGKQSANNTTGVSADYLAKVASDLNGGI